MIKRTPTIHGEQGATLVVTLVMLVLLTLFAISAINSGMVNLRIAGNMQAQDEARAAGQVAIERLISDVNNIQNINSLTWPRVTDVDLNNDGTNDYRVSIQKPVCVRAAPQIPPRDAQCAAGVKANLYCLDTIWQVTATARELRAGVLQQTVVQETVQGAAVTFPPTVTPSAISC
jgi:hypothetical protein